MDFGYVVNPGTTFTQKRYNQTEDNQFGIEVEIQMSDHELTGQDKEFKVLIGVKYGETLVSGMVKVIDNPMLKKI